MQDHDPGKDDTALAFQAFLYASGEMDGPEAALFETRLGEDQAARDALCQAVQLSYPQAGPFSLQPDPAYREQVRRRVQRRPGWWRWLTRKRSHRGHPAAWTGLGVIAALGVTWALSQGWPAPGPKYAPRVEQPSVQAKYQAQPLRTTGARDSKSEPVPESVADTTAAEAKVWAELQTRMPWRKRWLTSLGVKR
jgi:hypothetical protein